MTWITAFLITEAIEAPVYLYAGRRLAPWRRWLLAFGASAVTHPVVWFVFPWETGSWELCLLAAETFAVVVEGGLAWVAGLPRPWTCSLVANGASVLAGLAIHEAAARL